MMRTDHATGIAREQRSKVTPRTAVVVGVDGSPSSVDALRWAAREARLQGRALRVVTAYHWVASAIPGRSVYIDVDVLRDEAQDIQDYALFAAADELIDIEIESVVEFGPTANCLLSAATDAELLVLGSYGRGPLARLLMGSVGRDVVQRATCPVVVLPPSDIRTPDRADRSVAAVSVLAGLS
jgi:nucleotide-binding universal stress UspA family protein